MALSSPGPKHVASKRAWISAEKVSPVETSFGAIGEGTVEGCSILARKMAAAGLGQGDSQACRKHQCFYSKQEDRGPSPDSGSSTRGSFS